MDWELHDGQRQVGPADEVTVIRALESGRMSDTLMIRRVGEQEWRRVRSHVPFAMALDRGRDATTAGGPPSFATRPVAARPVRSGGGDIDLTRIAYAVGCGTVVLVLVVAVVKLTQSSTSPPPAKSEPTTRPAAAVTLAPPPVDAKAERAKALMSARTLAEALKLSKPAMTDVVNESSPGAAMLALWAWKNGHWTDFGVKDETTVGKVMKDSDAERGKRYCASGSIVQIQAEKFEGGKVDVGLMMDDSVRLFHFISVASSGELVQNSPARFCGVVTGKYDYANSAGGVGHAVELVGMFDLPENRKR